jgi:hypothetical protein
VIDWANATYPTVKMGNLITTGYANIAGNIISLNANLGNLAEANYISGTLVTSAQPNITSVGTLTSLASTGTVNFTGASNVSLGAIGNVKITGGTNGQYLTTDGTGNLSFGAVTSGTTITNDTSTNATYYPIFTTATSGTISAANVSSSKLYFNPSTGDMSATNFNSLSDITYKTNVEPILNGMIVVTNIEPVSFNWIESGKKAYGVIAQEIEKILPEIVTTNADGTKTVSYDQIIPFLVSAIQDLNRQIQELKNK